MKKQVTFTSQGQRADIGPYIINRILANRYVDAVGPFVFLDHAVPIVHSSDETLNKANGTGAHPHRGIATLTYILNGEADHHDSRGHHSKVTSGGAQWMKAGNGIIHDEAINVDPETTDRLTHLLQFWVNLPAKNKSEDPQYLPVQANEVPQQPLSHNSGWIKVIAGEYENLASKIPAYLRQFIYHIHLEPGKQFSMASEKGLEYAAFLPLSNAEINDQEYKTGEFLTFENDDGIIEINNKSDVATDVILFGGEPYTEPIFAAGPFVMNTRQEISQAYDDFYAGKYGQIQYQKFKN